MKRSVKNVVYSLSVILGLAVFWQVFVWANNWACGNKWRDSGMRYRWQVSSGCQLEYQPGKWIPEEKFRSI